MKSLYDVKLFTTLLPQDIKTYKSHGVVKAHDISLYEYEDNAIIPLDDWTMSDSISLCDGKDISEYNLGKSILWENYLKKY